MRANIVEKPQLDALAYLYDHLEDLPSWLKHLSPGQMKQLAAVLAGWGSNMHDSRTVHPLEEVEQREVTRALIVFNGDVFAAANALGIGKTTLYRKLKMWGFGPSDWRLVFQAAALASPVHISPRTHQSDFHNQQPKEA